MEALEFHNDWAMVSISELILAGCTALKIPIRDVRSVLQNWIGAYPNFVSPVTVSNRMILFGQPGQIDPPDPQRIPQTHNRRARITSAST